MAETSDHFFLKPRQLLSAGRIDFIDAINLVVYAELPLVTTLRGRELVAGYLCRDESGNIQQSGHFSGEEELIRRYAKNIDCLSFPVGPTHYEPLLDRMCRANESALPFFFHEHHLMVDRRRRSAIFARAHKELRDEIAKKEVSIQIKKYDMTSFLPPGASMTQDELQAYLYFKDALDFWENEANIKSHAHLERVLLSDSLSAPPRAAPPGKTNEVSVQQLSPEQESYDEQQLPSFLLANKLLRKSRFAHFVQQAQPTSLASTRTSVTEDQDSPSLQGPIIQTSSSVPEVDQLDSGGEKSTASQPKSFGLSRVKVAAHSKESTEMQSGSSPVPSQDSQGDPGAGKSVAKPGHSYMSRQDMANVLGKSLSSIDNYRKQPSFPEEFMIGGTPSYRSDHFHQWAESNKKKKKTGKAGG